MTQTTTSKEVIVLDTSAILFDPSCIYGFPGIDVYIPVIVLDEIDKFRSLDTEVGRNARVFIRDISKLLDEGGNLSEGIQKDDLGGKLMVKFLSSESVPAFLFLDKNDDKILATSLEIGKETGCIPSILTKDISLSVKANVIGLKGKYYSNDKPVDNVSELYTGVKSIEVDSDIIDDVYEKGSVSIERVGIHWKEVLHENMGVVLVDDLNSNHSGLAIYRNGMFKKVKNGGFKIINNIEPLNKEQYFAADLMLDNSIKLVSLTGPAGGGKTVCAMAACLKQVLDSKAYDRLIITRPIQPMGKDLGYIPGDELTKMQPWIAPIRDAVEVIFGGGNEGRKKFDELIDYGIIEIAPLTYIRGRSLQKTLFILDESQSLTNGELKAVLTRIGKDSKIILTGDIFQIDNPYLDSLSNGLTYVIEKFKDYPIAGHITLSKGQRSELATLAASIL